MKKFRDLRSALSSVSLPLKGTRWAQSKVKTVMHCVAAAHVAWHDLSSWTFAPESLQAVCTWKLACDSLIGTPTWHWMIRRKKKKKRGCNKLVMYNLVRFNKLIKAVGATTFRDNHKHLNILRPSRNQLQCRCLFCFEPTYISILLFTVGFL